MKTRALYKYIDENGTQHTSIVWFGSAGRTAIGFDISKWDIGKWDDTSSAHIRKAENFSEQQQSVADNLTQRLSIVKGELWYNINYGQPIFEKTKSKAAFDAFILTVVKQHPDVNSIISFNSQIVNKKYTCNIQIESIYGQITLNL